MQEQVKITPEQALQAFAQLMALDSLKLSQREHLILIESLEVLREKIKEQE